MVQTVRPDIINRKTGSFTAQTAISATCAAHLVLSDLHVQDDVVDELRQSFLHCTLELIVLQQRVDKLEDAEDQILKTQHFTCKNNPPENKDLQAAVILHVKLWDDGISIYHLNLLGHPLPLYSLLLFLHK